MVETAIGDDKLVLRKIEYIEKLKKVTKERKLL
jgi:hypothetical protein